MKTTLWKTIAALALAAVLLTGGSALALARYPAATGTLTDDANVLGHAVAADIAAYADAVKAETGVGVRVAVVQFLDGEPVQTYADTLFSRWSMGENDVLLLGAAAEDAFAVAAGAEAAQKLSAASLRSLLYDSGFAQAFAKQQYDAAMGGFFTGLNALLGKQYGAKIDMDGLFADYRQAQAQPEAPQDATQGAATVGQTVGNVVDGALSAVDGAVQGVVQASSSVWSSTVDAVTNTLNSFNRDLDKRDENGGGLTPGGWVVLGIIVLIVVGQSRRARRSSRHYADAARNARNAANSASDAAHAAARQARDAAQNAARDARNSARNVSSDVRDSARDVANELRNAAREAAREAKRAWKEGRW